MASFQLFHSYVRNDQRIAPTEAPDPWDQTDRCSLTSCSPTCTCGYLQQHVMIGWQPWIFCVFIGPNIFSKKYLEYYFFVCLLDRIFSAKVSWIFFFCVFIGPNIFSKSLLNILFLRVYWTEYFQQKSLINSIVAVYCFIIFFSAKVPDVSYIGGWGDPPAFLWLTLGGSHPTSPVSIRNLPLKYEKNYH
jgi:hypothetical protein